ncbi:putative Ig domain-containing protein [Thalassomonas actiniarum]|uniref:Dystroglycan-type cadherin-like domain-containing protein n=1 Tax=Thalassomonas actiniarum TaxID=485447 RepID=A0AAE9YRD0_9GAMM|nr:putative Ig domain-containing protein [Thalassomonas actiniarum]WDD99466.1 hypothetical protein SG35_001945 [Thalassomonas actiniarum]
MKPVHFTFLLLLALAATSLSGCGGDSGDAGTPASNPPKKEQNLAPVILGEPLTVIGFNEEYQFLPQVSDDGKSKLVFSIANKPAWCSFNAANGRLTGLPFSTEAGLYSDIVISVSDGIHSVSLPAFSIRVRESMLLHLSGEPKAFSTLGNEYRFKPGIALSSNIDKAAVSYAISNQPGWMTFDSITGELSGVPGTADLGWYKGIVISASYQDVTTEFPAFDIEVRPLSNFVIGKQMIEPDYATSVPAKGEKRIDATTGAELIRLTDAAELKNSDDAMIVYSRYSPENIKGDALLVFGTDSYSSWVVNPDSGDIIAALVDDKGKPIGEKHELRWHGSAKHPNRVYYIKGMQFWMIDDVTRQEQTRKLIRDFSSLFPNAVKIYNDVEGDSSNDSDHWAWMAVHYGVNYIGHKSFLVDGFIHYQVSTDTVHTLTPGDLAGTNLALESKSASFRHRPNMVEVSPLGTGIVIHTGRMWDDTAYGGSKKDFIGTWFDGPHLWPLDFDHSKKAPVKISVTETHSGWSFNDSGQEVFVSQNNRTDKLDAVVVDGENSGFDNRLEVASHKDFGWNMGFHYGKMPPSKPGWLFMSSYSKQSDLWAGNQLMMIQLVPESERPVIWRIAPTYTLYNGNYRDEVPAAVNFSGDRIYFSSNWGGMLDHREVFQIKLPSDWHNRIGR